MKKYTPSGYQIINIDVSDKTSGTPFTPETEDEKLLHSLLSSGKLEPKPILLTVYGGENGYYMSGFGVINPIDKSITLTYGPVGGSITEKITVSSDKLQWELAEE